MAKLCDPTAAVRQPGRLLELALGGPQTLRPRLTTGLPFSLAHTDARGCRHIPNACYECTIHCILASRNTLWRIVVAEGLCLRLAFCLSHARLITSER